MLSLRHMNQPQMPPSPDQFPQPSAQFPESQMPPPPNPPPPAQQMPAPGGFQQPYGQMPPQNPTFPVPPPPANQLQQPGSPLPNQPPQAQVPLPPQPQQPVGQPPAQEGTAQFQPAEAANEPSWLKILVVFGGGFAVTILPLFFGIVLYIVQFGFAASLITDGRKTQDGTKRMACYVMAGVMCLLGLAALGLAFGGE